MGSFFRWSSASATLLALGMLAATVTPITVASVAIAQTTPPSTTPSTTSTSNFSDVSSDYWALPFIQALAERNIITGFPDGTFKPNQSVTRAEFATLIKKAFNQSPVRQLSSSGFRDVPANYWAADAIREAYETGFLTGYPGDLFQPNQQIPKVQALVALTNGLGLSSSDNTSTVNSTYYTDASAIPNYAVNNVAAATQANLVVNYPNVNQLNPQVSLTRAEAAAILYQALVKQGQLQALGSNVPATSYIVASNAASNTGSAQTNNNIVSLAASSNSFSTLTSLLQTAGLTDVLQQPGPYTVFAPTNEAFAALPASTLEQLQRPENREVLIKILRYHVVPGAITSSQLSTGEVKTAEDASVNIKVDSATNQVSVNEARVIQPGVQASNGIIYPINAVLIPPNLTVSQQPQNGTGTSDVTPGRATRGGSSYVGVAGNIGLTGDTALGDTNFSVISKIGLTRFLSVRPSAVFGDDTVVLVPVTFDLAPRAVNPTGDRTFPVSPYLGAGVAIDTENDADVGLLLTGGIDVPLGSRFTATGAVNAAFLDDTNVGLVLGVGLNF
ncbi:S-layer homology domain-containing protein [Nostoc sp. CENA67]|uniref:S-layer homology domain-containing protein n=1 Tax=Amazonocrinis nigriterrae CENA67 TaxID=2794033 RepID=A0A8J7LD74_9NOST|nr:S-layer homology domain-containing protein [Amazonocrinis nigriterrae]MBH8567181.1 S-layer homology domain-containing protein [Amazonocrinis nigriterrae CENA67]